MTPCAELFTDAAAVFAAALLLIYREARAKDVCSGEG